VATVIGFSGVLVPGEILDIRSDCFPYRGLAGQMVFNRYPEGAVLLDYTLPSQERFDCGLLLADLHGTQPFEILGLCGHDVRLRFVGPDYGEIEGWIMQGRPEGLSR
jgi:hypothetical protein